jgi:hypothetical protein
MPRGGARKGSGRKQLGKRRVTVHLDPDILSLFAGMATFEKISIGAAIEKIITDPNFAILPAPHAPNEIHYSMTIGGSRVTVQMLKTVGKGRLRSVPFRS